LQDGCVPRFGNPQREVFLEETEPATTCPRRPSENFFESIGHFLEDLFSGEPDGPEPEPEQGVTADGSRDVLGSGRVAKKENKGKGNGKGRGRKN
jgi:hypothetical protein